MPHYEADLTTTQIKDSVCDWCKQIYPAGTKLHYMQDCKHPNKPGCSVCDSCHDYYLSKPTTCCVDGLLNSIFPILAVLINSMQGQMTESNMVKVIKWRYITTQLLPNEQVRFINLCQLSTNTCH